MTLKALIIGESMLGKKLEKYLGAALIVGWIVLLQGCASAITSERIDKNTDLSKGIIYHMPKRSIRIDIVVSDPPSTGSPSSSAGVSNSISNNIAASSGKDTSPGNSAAMAGNPSCPSSASYCRKEVVTETDKGAKSTAVSTTTTVTTVNPNPSDNDKAIAGKSPKIVTITIANNISSETVPDLSKNFVLHYDKNVFGQNDMAIGVNNYGLLSVSHSDYVSKFDQIASNIAVDVASGMMGAGFLSSASANNVSPLTTYTGIASGSYIYPSDNSVIFKLSSADINECPVGSYTYSIDPAKLGNGDRSGSLCGIEVLIKPLFNDDNDSDYRFTDKDTVVSPNMSTGSELFSALLNGLTQPNYSLDFKSYPGLFYRQDLPYDVAVKVSSKKEMPESHFVALSPNQSATYFAPILETIFANNTSDITLANGVITGLKESTDSELYALSKIPADVMGNYTNAVGQVFSALGSVANAKNSMNSALANPTTTAQIKSCLTAVATYPTAGLTGAALSSALANINAACSH